MAPVPPPVVPPPVVSPDSPVVSVPVFVPVSVPASVPVIPVPVLPDVAVMLVVAALLPLGSAVVFDAVLLATVVDESDPDSVSPQAGNEKRSPRMVAVAYPRIPSRIKRVSGFHQPAGGIDSHVDQRLRSTNKF